MYRGRVHKYNSSVPWCETTMIYHMAIGHPSRCRRHPQAATATHPAYGPLGVPSAKATCQPNMIQPKSVLQPTPQSNLPSRRPHLHTAHATRAGSHSRSWILSVPVHLESACGTPVVSKLETLNQLDTYRTLPLNHPSVTNVPQALDGVVDARLLVSGSSGSRIRRTHPGRLVLCLMPLCSLGARSISYLVLGPVRRLGDMSSSAPPSSPSPSTTSRRVRPGVHLSSERGDHRTVQTRVAQHMPARRQCRRCRRAEAHGAV